MALMGNYSPFFLLSTHFIFHFHLSFAIKKRTLQPTPQPLSSTFGMHAEHLLYFFLVGRQSFLVSSFVWPLSQDQE